MKYLIPAAILSIFLIAATDIGDVREEVRDYQKRGACFKADLDFNGRVNMDDLRMISGDPQSGLGGFYARATFPFWYDQDRDGAISILDVSAVAGKIGQACG